MPSPLRPATWLASFDLGQRNIIDVPLKEHEPAGDEQRLEQLRHQDVLAVGPLLLHPPDVGVNRGQLG